ncbi:MAG: hypothetical protein SFW66_07635 [Gammaproteobacteria bacterium]|nr:hypothetical protein [Gammaproteobacteria bacterium]
MNEKCTNIDTANDPKKISRIEIIRECIAAVLIISFFSYFIYMFLAGIVRALIKVANSQFVIDGGTLLGWLSVSGTIIGVIFFLGYRERIKRQ